MKNTDQALSNAILKGIELAEKSGKFIVDQAPELIQEFYRWQIAKNILGFIFFLAVAIFTFLVFKRKVNLIKSGEIDFDEPQHFFVTIFSIISGLISIGFLCEKIYYITFILVSPKLYLIEYFIK